MREFLSEAATTGGIKLLAIVDDAYDPPAGSEISENAYNMFVQAAENDGELLPALKAAQTGLDDNHLEDWEEFVHEEAVVQRLWKLHVGTMQLAKSEAMHAALTSLFSDVMVDRISKLTQLKPLEDLLEGVAPLVKFGSDADPSLVAAADVVFLDLYLSSDVPSIDDNNMIPKSVLDRARERAISYVGQVRAVTEDNLEKVAPAFILISSLGSQQKASSFRQRAGQMASRFRFVSKLSLQKPDAEAILSIGDIFRTAAACAIVEPIQKAWKRVLDDAHGWINERLLNLDISDFGRLHHMRLNTEGQPFEDYVRELVAGALAERIVVGFSTYVPAKKRVDPFGKSIGYFEPPSNAFAELYSANRMSSDRGYRGPTGHDVMSGDIYLVGAMPQRKGSLTGKSLVAVMSPACDLIDRRGDGPSAKSILLLSGALQPSTLKHDRDPQILVVGDKFYEVAWDKKYPQALTVADLRRKIVANELTWIGRLKSDHFLAVQADFLSDLGRIGLIKAPMIFQNLSGAIRVREHGVHVDVGKPFKGSNRFAFLMAEKTKPLATQPLIFSGEFIQEFMALMTTISEDPTRLQATKDKASGILERMNVVFKMLENRTASAHSIQNYMQVELLGSKTQAPAMSAADGIFTLSLWQN